MSPLNQSASANATSTCSQLAALRLASSSSQPGISAETTAAAPLIISQRQLADYLGVCERTVRNLERQRVLPRIKLGKRTVYRLDSVLSSLSRMEQREDAR
jgi:transcriptional regulator with XRE-family HTH domain